MAKKNYYNRNSTPSKSSGEVMEANAPPPEVANMLAKVKQLLDEQAPEKALDASLGSCQC